MLRVRSGDRAPPGCVSQRMADRLLVENFSSEAKSRENSQARRLPCAARGGAGCSPATLAVRRRHPDVQRVRRRHRIRPGAGHPRHRAAARVDVHPAATGQVGFARVAAGGDLLPGVAGTARPRPAPRPTSTSQTTAVPSAPARASSTRQRQSGPARRLDRDVHPVLQGRAGVRRAAARTRRRRRRPDVGQRLRRAGHRHVDRRPRVTKAEAADRAVAFVKSSPATRPATATASAKELQASARKLMVYRDGVIRGDAGANRLAYVGRGAQRRRGARAGVRRRATRARSLNRCSMIDNALDRELYETRDSRPWPTWSGRRATRSRAASTRTSRTW